MPSASLVRYRSPNRNNNGRPRLRQGQVRRIVALIITLVVLLYLNNYAMEMSAADALKVRRSILNSFFDSQVLHFSTARYNNQCYED